MHWSVKDFGEDFEWGVSSAAYQIEGAHVKHGKGLSIWDDFTHRKGKIVDDHNADISADFYHNYHQDLSLMSAMNIPNFRFSLSWSRIFPEGTGHINRYGVDYYNRLIDFCLELDIKPWITLYHWDLPLALEKKGGWTNRDIIGWFTDYVSFCIRTFGDRVEHWMILNEPMVFTGAGYFLGIHAPGRKGLKNFMYALHHAALCQAEGARAARATRKGLSVGSTFSFSHVEPYTLSEEDRLAADRIDTLLNRTLLEPLLGRGYPVKDLKVLQRVEECMKDGDELRMQCALDFVGMQSYTREMVAFSYFTPLLQAKIVKASERKVAHTLMNWEVYPESIYQLLKKLSDYPEMPKIIITENGAAFHDQLHNGHINDDERIAYLETHLGQVLRAKKEGVNVQGYFIWTFTDNFEWAEGYKPRFGLVHVDFETQKRTVKASGKWYQQFLKGGISIVCADNNYLLMKNKGYPDQLIIR